MTTSSGTEQRVAGVLGGLGPDATVDFMARVITATDATSDQDHIPMLVDHNPRVPNRHAAIGGGEDDVGPELVAMAQRLEAAGADFLVMPCNTAHAWAGDIGSAVSIPFISIIDVVLDALGKQSARQVGVMAAEGCLRAGLYQGALEAAGYEPLTWSDSELDTFMALVYRIKAGERDEEIRGGLCKLAADLEFAGAEILVAGCTEIPLFLDDSDLSLTLLSSTDLLAERTIELAGGSARTED